ncbi:MAG: FtsW/RodA/SpoVE family cell cycle protein [Rhodospirillaceae bacterium]|nr:FtsW/RodA/SpoVE family cell cycle protein [Rhodospirillaceae bacterium]
MRPRNALWSGLAAFLSALGPAILTYAALIGWGWLTWQVIANAPPGKMAGTVTVKAADVPKILGYLELGQRSGAKSAAAEHLLIDRRNGQWVLSNRSQNKRVLLTTTRFQSRFAERWILAAGDRMSLPGVDIDVVNLGRDTITLRDAKTGREVTWNGKALPKGEPLTEVCHSGLRRAINKAKWASRNMVPDDRPELRLFSVGGGVNCSDRWKMEQLHPEALFITWQAGKFLAAPGSMRIETLLRHKGEKGHGFADIVVPLASDIGRIESVVVGITRYRVDAKADELSLVPITNRVFFFANELDPPNKTNLNWVGDGNRWLDWLRARIFAVTIGLAVAGFAAFITFYGWFQRERGIGSLFLALAAVVPPVLGLWLTAMLQQSAGHPDRSLIVTLAVAAWFWASFVMVWAGRMRGYSGWIWAVATVLAGIGMTTLFQLGAGSDNTRWLRFFSNHAMILAMFGWTIAMLAAIPDKYWRRLWSVLFTREAIFTLLALVLMGAMVVQFFLGSEEGLFGFQPVELVKMTLVALLGFVGLHIFETRAREVRAYRRSPLTFMMPYFRVAAIFALIVFAMVAGVRDFSPLIIMLTIIGFWLWKVGSWRLERSGLRWLWWSIRPLMVLALLAVIYAGYKIYQDPSILPASVPKKERILVWTQPSYHPHTGSQVLSSMDLVGEAGLKGARQKWLDAFGRNGGVMALPEVQNDFVTAFLVNRFGGIAGLVLIATELVFVTLLFMLGGAIERHFGRGDFREQQLGVVLGFVIYGAACMAAAHWFISWGNVLGLLPVMGQPMTWVTAGTSHLVFFAMFVLFVALVSGWVLRGYLDEVKASAMPLKK